MYVITTEFFIPLFADLHSLNRSMEQSKPCWIESAIIPRKSSKRVNKRQKLAERVDFGCDVNHDDDVIWRTITQVPRGPTTYIDQLLEQINAGKAMAELSLEQDTLYPASSPTQVQSSTAIAPPPVSAPLPFFALGQSNKKHQTIHTTPSNPVQQSPYGRGIKTGATQEAPGGVSTRKKKEKRRHGENVENAPPHIA